MKKFFVRNIGISALLATMLLLVWGIAAAAAAPAAKAAGAWVRMPVDPTVLPPVAGPDAQAEPPLDSEDSAAVPSAPSVEPDEAPKGSTDVAAPAPTPPAESPAESPAAENSAPASAGKAAAEAPVAASAGIVRGVDLRSVSDVLELTISADRPVGKTEVFALDNPRRLVLDLLGPWKYRKQNVIRASEGAARHVVVGEHKDRLRLVIYFRTPPKGQLKPEISREGNRLILRISMP
ncbi:AMIN domain-containing protein [Pseudodesulfovibrio sp.]|uniref:AMIN domain-containing protein n=1 Tax=unclassified Pseudodesulfovibrio TaxID=2661612 RepID=UPI003B00FD8D